jgi:hypothetical protein
MTNTVITTEQRQLNSLIQEKFIYAMMRRSLNEVKNLLDDRGVFLNKNKLGYLAELEGILNSQSGLSVVNQLNFGISLDTIPGAEVIEFRFIGFKEIDILDFPPEVSLGTTPRKDEIVLRFVLQFEKNKIVKICTSRKYLDSKSLKSSEVLSCLN